MSTATVLPHPVQRRPLDSPAPTPVGGLRLTRRGRVVLLLLALGLVLGVSLLRPSGSVATAERGTDAPAQVVVVRSGQTLWDIAAARADDGDVRGLVEQIERLNALDSALVRAGERLLVPAAG